MKSQGLTIERLGLAPDILAGQVAVVTGGGRGIGREVVRALAWLGARVIVAEISTDGSETETMVTGMGGEARFIQVDVSSEAEVLRLAQETQNVYGPAQILVNNAILCPAVPVLEMDVQTWDMVMGVNLRGAFLTSRAFLPGMIELGRGTIVNMISTEAMPLLSAYMASKQGLLAFSQSLAAEVANTGVRVIAFAPGFVATPSLKAVAERLAPKMGIRPEEFLSMPLHPGYSGSMPAEDAGAATAYLIAGLADTYNGEATNGFTVLEQAGYLRAAPVDSEVQAREMPIGEETPAGTGKRDVMSQGIEACSQLVQILAQTAENFDKFPLFIRPFARNGFKNKAGLNLQDWQFTAQRWAGLFQKSASGDRTAAASLVPGKRSGVPPVKEAARILRWGTSGRQPGLRKTNNFSRRHAGFPANGRR